MLLGFSWISQLPQKFSSKFFIQVITKELHKQHNHESFPINLSKKTLSLLALYSITPSVSNILHIIQYSVLVGIFTLDIMSIWLGWKGGDQGRPNSILFVEELTDLISENLPDLWKLGQTYLNKTLFQVELNYLHFI